jgi:dolichol-phosphate mannosyltransferase
MNSNSKLLVFVPTYNEINNVESILKELFGLNLDADILFIDDCSPDGTVVFLDSLRELYSRLIVIHRKGKFGIGSAHRDAISWAYEHGYDKILTLDCDATHPPEYIPELLKKGMDHDIVVGSRHLKNSSLQDWSLKRKLLTKLGHWLTFYCLDVPYDATGAFRLYNLNKIPQAFLFKVRSQGYSFFFETLFVLHQNNFRVGEVPIHLPTRINDKSKMRYKDIYDSLNLLAILMFEKMFKSKKFKIENKNTY